MTKFMAPDWHMLKIIAPKVNCRNSQDTRQSTGKYRIKSLLESWRTKIHAFLQDYWIKKGGFFAPNFWCKADERAKKRAKVPKILTSPDVWAFSGLAWYPERVWCGPLRLLASGLTAAPAIPSSCSPGLS